MNKAKAYRGENGEWGVEQNGSVIYEPNFQKRTAKRLARLENLKNPPDWEHAQDVLIAEGYEF